VTQPARLGRLLLVPFERATVQQRSMVSDLRRHRKREGWNSEGKRLACEARQGVIPGFGGLILAMRNDREHHIRYVALDSLISVFDFEPAMDIKYW